MSPSGSLLEDVLSAYLPVRVHGPGKVALTGIATDSREVRPGYLFVAVPGHAENGEAYAESAVEAGAVAVVCREGALSTLGAIRVEVRDPRQAAALYAARFYAPPPRQVVAVTGTDGKSSTVEFIRQLWAAAGIAGASLGTIGMAATKPLAGDYEALNTTPGAVALHRLLQRLSREGIDHVALEASSHGLDQARLDGLAVDVGVWTTFGSDHLDYHATLEAYFDAKARLFRARVKEGGTAVLNADDPSIASLATEFWGRGLQVARFGRDPGLAGDGDAGWLETAEPVAEGQRVSMTLGGIAWRGVIPLYGRFQIMNVLGAALAVLAENVSHEAIFRALPVLSGVRGRLEKVATKNDAPIFVDYAHTAQAIEQALSALRPHTRGKLRIVFGCGGDRDAAKRPEMGRAAARLADELIVTDDNPRTENAAAIRRAVLAGCPDAIEIGDRRAAINEAVARTGQGDVLLIAGKGHETYQIVGKEKHPFDDAEEARKAVA